MPDDAHEPRAVPGDEPRVVARVAARVLLVDVRGRVLLFRARGLTGSIVWVPVGGAVEGAESLRACAVREVLEETGQQVDVGEALACTREQHRVRDVVHDCFEHVFVAATDSCIVDTSGFTQEETARISAHRWWPLDELLGGDASFYPTDLRALAQGLLSDHRSKG